MMHQEGHAGMALAFYAPAAFVLVLLGEPRLALSAFRRTPT